YDAGGLSKVQQLTTLTPITPDAVARLTIAIGSISLVGASVFAFLDLAGMIVLRSRMWRQIADVHGLGWRSPAAKAACLDSAPGLAASKQCRYKMAARHPVSWWQRWVFIEDLVFAVQRNVAFIRLTVSVVLAVAWSAVVVQLAVASLTGRCRLVVRGSHLVDDPTRTLQLCDLMRKGVITTAVVWASWTLLALLLVFLNTRSSSSRPQMLNYDISGIPMNIIDYGPPGTRQPTGGAPGNNKQAAMAGQPSSAPHHYYYSNNNPATYVPPQPQQQHHYQQKQPHVPRHGSGAGQKRVANRHMRSSWSQLDEDSIVSDAGRSDSQSMLPSQSKAQLFLQSQNMLHQFYHMQNQQLQGMHAYMPPTRISEERQKQAPAVAGAKPSARRRVQSVFHKSRYSTTSTVPEPPDASRTGHRASYNDEGNERLAVREQLRRSRDEQGGLRHAVLASKQTHAVQGMRAQGDAGSSENAQPSRSLASLRCDVGAGYAGQSGAGNSKRNTIG
ncbi:hypothetical protein GGF43_005128, partial [Coemansia sp. RSA 2618]